MIHFNDKMFFGVIPTGITICCGHCRKNSNAAGGDVIFSAFIAILIVF